MSKDTSHKKQPTSSSSRFTALRIRMIAAVFFSVVAVFAISFFLVAVSSQTSTQDRLDAMTKLIADNGGEIPSFEQYSELDEASRAAMLDFTEESPYRIRYFTVVDNDNGYVRIDHIAAVDSNKALNMAQDVKDEDKQTGYYGKYRFRVSDDQEQIVFLDASYELDSLGDLLRRVAMIEIVLALFIVSAFAFASSKVVRPFEENAKAQKRFITDAGHELKTPAAIIASNAEVLEYKYGENEWTRAIVEQTEKMGMLVDEMVCLSRLDEVSDAGRIQAKEEVNISDIAKDTLSGFERVFSSRNISVRSDIDDDVSVMCNIDQMSRLFSVLIENASKYCDDGGDVYVHLYEKGSHAVIDISNTYANVDKIDLERIFDRFFRPDASRTSATGGTGIGLSIAQMIVNLHGGKIKAKSDGDMIVFSVSLPKS